jgi:hypothetical protein
MEKIIRIMVVVALKKAHVAFLETKEKYNEQ